MKKKFAAVLLSIAALALVACGGGEADLKAAAEDYNKLLEGDDSTYYYEADVTEEFPEDEADPEQSIMAEARDGKGKHIILSGVDELDTRDIETEDAYYYVYDPDKEYTKEPKEDLEEDMELQYAGTSEMELDGKTYSYYEFQDEYEMEGISEDGENTMMDTYLYKKRYLLDEKANLYAIVYLQEMEGKDGDENQLIYKKVERITKLEEGKVPDGIFDIPKGYKNVTQEESDELDEGMILDEDITEEE